MLKIIIDVPEEIEQRMKQDAKNCSDFNCDNCSCALGENSNNNLFDEMCLANYIFEEYMRDN